MMFGGSLVDYIPVAYSAPKQRASVTNASFDPDPAPISVETWHKAAARGLLLPYAYRLHEFEDGFSITAPIVPDACVIGVDPVKCFKRLEEIILERYGLTYRSAFSTGYMCVPKKLD